MYTYIPSFLDFLPIPVIIDHWVEFPVLHNRFLLVIYFIHSSVYMWRRQWHPTPVLLPGKSHGWRSLVGCSPWGREELDMTERLPFHSSLSCTGEGNGNHSSVLAWRTRDGGAWWAAVYGVAQSQTRLKQLSSSSSVYMSILVSQFTPSPFPLDNYKFVLYICNSISALQISSSVSFC